MFWRGKQPFWEIIPEKKKFLASVLFLRVNNMVQYCTALLTESQDSPETVLGVP